MFVETQHGRLHNMVSGKASESLDLVVSGELFKAPSVQEPV